MRARAVRGDRAICEGSSVLAWPVSSFLPRIRPEEVESVIEPSCSGQAAKGHDVGARGLQRSLMATVYVKSEP